MTMKFLKQVEGIIHFTKGKVGRVHPIDLLGEIEYEEVCKEVAEPDPEAHVAAHPIVHVADPLGISREAPAAKHVAVPLDAPCAPPTPYKMISLPFDPGRSPEKQKQKLICGEVYLKDDILPQRRASYLKISESFVVSETVHRCRNSDKDLTN